MATQWLKIELCAQGDPAEIEGMDPFDFLDKLGRGELFTVIDGLTVTATEPLAMSTATVRLDLEHQSQTLLLPDID